MEAHTLAAEDVLILLTAELQPEVIIPAELGLADSILAGMRRTLRPRDRWLLPPLLA